MLACFTVAPCNVCVCQSVNKAMQKEQEELNIGVLDIYGFEIFQVSTDVGTFLLNT